MCGAKVAGANRALERILLALANRFTICLKIGFSMFSPCDGANRVSSVRWVAQGPIANRLHHRCEKRW